MAHLALREAGMRRLLHRLAVDVGDQPAARQAAYLGVGEVLAGKDSDYARGLHRGVGGDFSDLRVCVGGAYERRIGLVRHRHVIGVLAGAGEEAVILLARDARADERGVHNLPPIAFAPAMMLFTMLW